MKRMSAWITVMLAVFATVRLAAAEPSLPDPLQYTFYPYSAGPLRQDGIIPGMTIGQHNWQVAEQVLPAEILRPVQTGDFTITVQETTDLPPRAPYVEATAAQFHGVSLNGGYHIDNYHAGRPFPVLDLTDPRAGEKAAWNFRYRDMPDTIEMRGTMDGVNSTGAVDRTGTGRMRVRFGMHRVGSEENITEWQDDGIHIKASFEALAPSDLEGNIRITTYYDNDAQPSTDLMYSPQSRRARKGYVNMIMRMGGGRYDILQEEQPPFFFIGYLYEYNWTYKGEPVMLVPGFLKADHLTHGGKNDWYPEVPWELRRVVVLESTPKSAHPYSKRIFYLDAQTYTPLCVLTYDSKGAFVRLSLIVHGNPDFVPGAQGIRLPVPLGATWVNFAQNQAYRMTAANPVFHQDFSPRRFEMMELLRKGK